MLQRVESARCESCKGSLEWVGEYYHCVNCGRVLPHGSD
jgi:tRNA(Ile2) C34 agmatinyltransferase TiaS